MTVYEILVELPYFSALPEDELNALCSAADMVDVARGEVVIGEGEDVEALFIVTAGAFEATRRSGAGSVVLGVAGIGEVLGEMSFLEGRPASATLTALSPARVVRLPASRVKQILDHPPFLQAMFRTMTQRLREREASLVHAEKLVALGTMTAGLLHEINNPAAAIRRSAAGLVEASERLVGHGEPATLSVLERTRLEDEMTDYLEESGVTDAFDLAASLVEGGWSVEELAQSANSNEEVERFARLVHARQLAAEVAVAAGRLSELVSAVKTWVYLDQGPRQQFDFNLSIQQTMALLRHKVGDIEVALALDPDLPSVEGSGAELNQVVTNLIDNALQAEGSKVSIRTRVEDGTMVLEVEDNGTGIPAELAERIWEPFFTTKEPGKGTGLGLSTSRRIVESHRGQLEVTSEPGRTVFSVHLPLVESTPDSP